MSKYKTSYIIYVEHWYGSEGFSESHRFKIVALIRAWEHLKDGYKVRIQKDRRDYDD